jgi:uncharacterized protein (TIGR00251 family)
MDEFAVLRVRLTPKGGRTEVIRRDKAGVVYVRVAAPPVDGAANRALIALLSDALHVPKSRIAFQAGETRREKTLRIAGLDAPTLEIRLAEAIR